MGSLFRSWKAEWTQYLGDNSLAGAIVTALNLFFFPTLATMFDRSLTTPAVEPGSVEMHQRKLCALSSAAISFGMFAVCCSGSQPWTRQGQTAL